MSAPKLPRGSLMCLRHSMALAGILPSFSGNFLYFQLKLHVWAGFTFMGMRSHHIVGMWHSVALPNMWLKWASRIAGMLPRCGHRGKRRSHDAVYNPPSPISRHPFGSLHVRSLIHTSQPLVVLYSCVHWALFIKKKGEGVSFVIH